MLTATTLVKQGFPWRYFLAKGFFIEHFQATASEQVNVCSNFAVKARD